MTRATTPHSASASALPTSGPRRHLTGAPLLVAAGGARPDRLPVWFMRQAGRSLPEYRALRVGTRMLDACLEPDLAAEITLQPIRRHGVDAAILFSDIVVPLKAAGVDVDIVAGTGPVIATPVRGAADVAALPELTPDQMAPVAAAIRTLIGELGEVPLIGFAGAPLTLASYLVEGGPSRNHERTKALMHGEPDTWHALMAHLTDLVITALRAQIDAGVDAVQLFDSWAGIVSERDYREFVAPHSARVLDAVSGTVPRWHFGVGTGELLGAMAEPAPGVTPEVVGVDWRVSLTAAAQRVRAARPDRPVVLQGNLDPAMLDAGWPAVERAVRRVVDEGRAADAHIVNLGHGVLPGTDPDVLTRIVELVHSL